jgi:hypothetical protein
MGKTTQEDVSMRTASKRKVKVGLRMARHARHEPDEGPHHVGGVRFVSA